MHKEMVDFAKFGHIYVGLIRVSYGYIGLHEATHCYSITEGYMGYKELHRVTQGYIYGYLKSYKWLH